MPQLKKIGIVPNKSFDNNKLESTVEQALDIATTGSMLLMEWKHYLTEFKTQAQPLGDYVGLTAALGF